MKKRQVYEVFTMICPKCKIPFMAFHVVPENNPDVVHIYFQGVDVKEKCLIGDFEKFSEHDQGEGKGKETSRARGRLIWDRAILIFDGQHITDSKQVHDIMQGVGKRLQEKISNDLEDGGQNFFVSWK